MEIELLTWLIKIDMSRVTTTQFINYSETCFSELDNSMHKKIDKFCYVTVTFFVSEHHPFTLSSKFRAYNVVESEDSTDHKKLIQSYLDEAIDIEDRSYLFINDTFTLTLSEASALIRLQNESDYLLRIRSNLNYLYSQYSSSNLSFMDADEYIGDSMFHYNHLRNFKTFEEALASNAIDR